MSSNPKEIIFDSEAREKLKKGINELADCVAVTLGPKGRNVAISSWASPKITHDGNSVLEEIELKDDFENMGVLLAKELSTKIKESCGDGTTTGIVLLRSLVNEGMKNISYGASAISIKKGMEKALEILLKEIDLLADKIKTEEDIKNIATVSASGDEIIGRDIADCFKKANGRAAITIEQGKKNETQIIHVEGMEIERGYLSPYFCNNEKKMTVEMENPKILVTDKKINSIQDLLPILQIVSSTTDELLIIADEIEGDALATLVINNLKKIIKVAAIKTPSFGDRKKDILEDIAILCGATFICEEKGHILKNTTFENLGSCEKIIISKDKTLIINGHGKDLEKRINQLEKEKENTKEKFDKSKLEERISKLKGGVVIINVGAQTESDLKQRRQKYEDSLNSTKAAIEEGIVPGGGVALLRARIKINELQLNEEEKIGAEILQTACLAPIKQILSNAGFDHSQIIQSLLEKEKSFGFNVITEQIEDFIKTGIIDPVKVVRTYLINVVSIAKLILLSEVLITDAKEKK
jgi:chaperonin GroEL